MNSRDIPLRTKARIQIKIQPSLSKWNQTEFKAELCYNFIDHCTGSGKNLGDLLDAAHIESAVKDDYRVSNDRHLHRLFDANKMAARWAGYLRGE